MTELHFESTGPVKSLHRRWKASTPPCNVIFGQRLPSPGDNNLVLSWPWERGTGHCSLPAPAEKRCPENCGGGNFHRSFGSASSAWPNPWRKGPDPADLHTQEYMFSLDGGKGLESEESSPCSCLNPRGSFVIPLPCHISSEGFTLSPDKSKTRSQLLSACTRASSEKAV